MASSSSSSRTCEAKYHVFLSFRGKDTRNNFTSHLYMYLYKAKGVETFIDCNDLKRGEKISESLLKAIEQSKIAIIVFSKGYASSTWCLEELVKIIDREESGGLTVLPVFYHVDPSDVRKQSGTFREAFANLEERFKEELGKVQKWRSALTKAADLGGFHIEDTSPEAELVEEIVTRVLEIVNRQSPINNNGLVGIESRIEDVKCLLQLESNDVFAIGLWGMGGIGKTTLASAVFEEIMSQFDRTYFQENVREEVEKNGLSSMHEKLLSKILKDDNATSRSTFTETRLQCKKILLVLDDVTSRKHKDGLIKQLNRCFGYGSRMIITSRDKEIIQYFEVKENKIYDVKLLSDMQGLELFSQHAFKKEYPAEGYVELSKKIVRHTIVKGVPLALKVFGSMLFGKSKREWERAINELDRNPIADVIDVLKLSYDRLSDDEKDIFLDIACIHNGKYSSGLDEILEDNGFALEFGVRQLIKKSLITEVNRKIFMHDLLQEMGRKIAKKSRLQSHEDVDSVLRNNTGSPEIEVIQWDISKISKKIKLDPDTFWKMPNLRLIDFFPSPDTDFWCPWRWRWRLPYEENKIDVLTCEDLDFVCSRLRWLRWFKYPLKSLPSRFDPRNLVVLVMPYSHIEQLGNDDQHFLKLKHIDLSHSKHLTKIEHLSPCLETLILEGCSSLTELPPSDLQDLKKLTVLNLKDCQSLGKLPTSLQSESLEDVILSGTAIEKLPFIKSSHLWNLEFENCSRLESLPSTICNSSGLIYLPLSGCSKLERLPIDIGNMESLQSIRANYTALRELSSSITQLNHLHSLYLRGCKGQELLDSSLSLLSGLESLETLDLSYCQITKLPISFGRISFLRELDLSENEFECVPANIFKDLRMLEKLNVSNCERLQSLWMLPGVLELQAHDCTSLESLPDLSFCARRGGEQLNFANCFKLDRNALKANIENALLEFESKVLKIPYTGGALIVYPGNEIPEFFSSQAMESSITLDPLLDCLKKKLFPVRFMLCVVLTFEDNHIIDGTLRVHYKCTMDGKDGKMRRELLRCFSYSKSSFTNFGSFQSWTIKSSDHVFLCHDSFIDSRPPVRWEEIQDVERVTFDFYVDGCEDIHVKKCGVKFLFNEKEEEETEEEEEETEEEEEEPEEEEEEETEEEEEEPEEDEEETEEEEAERQTKRLKV